MEEIRFVWRQSKYEQVRREHKVSFGEAVDAMLDDEGLDIPDELHWERAIFVGRTPSGRLLMVVYTLELDEQAAPIFRLITAYDAPKEKADAYQER